jgi:hypothetical protein
VAAMNELMNLPHLMRTEHGRYNIYYIPGID